MGKSNGSRQNRSQYLFCRWARTYFIRSARTARRLWYLGKRRQQGRYQMAGTWRKNTVSVWNRLWAGFGKCKSNARTGNQNKCDVGRICSYRIWSIRRRDVRSSDSGRQRRVRSIDCICKRTKRSGWISVGCKNRKRFIWRGPWRSYQSKRRYNSNWKRSKRSIWSAS